MRSPCLLACLLVCSSAEVFSRFHQVPFAKMLTFYRREPFVLEAHYSEAADVPQTVIGKYTIPTSLILTFVDNHSVKGKLFKTP